MTTQALTGLKVADFGWITVEPYLTKFLAEHGAEVVRLETRTKLDISRVSAPYRDNVIEPNRRDRHTRHGRVRASHSIHHT